MLERIICVNARPLRSFATQANSFKSLKGKWKSVVGLEIHAQITSKTKLFSASPATFGAPPNSAVSYFDAAIPGTLPVLNGKCVEAGVKTALALGCTINEVSMFDRKHYFYADLPAGFQITQHSHALANHGLIAFPVIVPGKKVYYKTSNLLQLQLEQDSGKLLHDEQLKRTLIDLNRAGLPLMELVFAPDLETGEEAASLVKELILILRRLKTCSCKMEEGALRVDANISIHKEGDPLGVRTELKNIGSVRSIAQAVTYEIQRQVDVIAEGGTVVNETRAWDAEKRCTISMRDKEVYTDYRFMPDPNLLPLKLKMQDDDCADDNDIKSVPALQKEIPELPEETRKKLVDDYKLNQDVAIILVNEPILLEHFVNIMKELPSISTKSVTNFLINDLITFCNKANIDLEECNVNYEILRDILKALDAGEINLQAARKLIELAHEQCGKTVEDLISEHNLQQISDINVIREYCQQAIQKQEKAVKQYQNGKDKALLAIVGEVAKLSEQKANMKVVVKCLEEMLKRQ